MADVEKSIELNDAIFCAQHFKEVVSIAMLLIVVSVVADSLPVHGMRCGLPGRERRILRGAQSPPLHS